MAALALAALCSAANFCLAVSLYSLWRSSKRDAQQLGESEWEGLANAWVKSINALGGLTAFYFLIAAVANAIGFVGMVKVRRPRSLFIGDLAGLTLIIALTSISSIMARLCHCRPRLHNDGGRGGSVRFEPVHGSA